MEVYFDEKQNNHDLFRDLRPAAISRSSYRRFASCAGE
jgi:hypothetical protein